MSEAHDRICPWCQSEIVWDPEIGPEEACPHCLNDLGEYRSINLKVKQTGQPISFDEEEEKEYEVVGDDEDYEIAGGFGGLDDYEEGVQRLLDRQAEAPECPTCRSFMLLSGTRPAPADFEPFVHAALGRALLSPKFRVNVYVCPSCFKVDQMLSEADRLALIELLRDSEK